MPSPVGHALAGVAAAWLTGARLPQGRARDAAVFSAVAIAPDLDLVFGTHSTYTHSIGAVLVVSAIALATTRAWRLALGVAAAWASHLVLDWLGSDTSPPIGIMVLWPFDSGFYQSPVSIFDAISRRYWLPDQFILGNLRAALKEVIVLAPFFAGALYLGRRRRSS